MARKSRRSILECIQALYSQKGRWTTGSIRRLRNKKKQEYAYCLLGAVGHCSRPEDPYLSYVSTIGGGLDRPEEVATTRLLAQVIHDLGYGKTRRVPDADKYKNRQIIYHFNDGTNKAAVMRVVAEALRRVSK